MTPATIPDNNFDVLASGLDVVFCGINPPPDTAHSGLSFASASNRFWQVLHLAGFTAKRLRPEDGRQLLGFNCGLTAVVSRPTRRADEIATLEFREARPFLETKIRAYDPRVIAFLGKRALAGMLARNDTPWGLQPDLFVGRPAWVLPNPSGLNRSFPLDALVRAYGELHLFLNQTTSFGHATSRREDLTDGGSAP